MCIGGGDPKDTNHTPQRAMSFTSFGQFALQPRQRVISQSPNLLKRFLGPENPLTFHYLKQFHSGEFRIREGERRFNHNHTFYNELGNEIKFMHVYGNSEDNVIRMNMQTHDIIRGGIGRNVIHAGWGNDHLVSGNRSHNSDYNNQSYLYGGEGQDTLEGHGKTAAWGGEGNDTLIAYNDSSWYTVNSLYGGIGDDTLISWGTSNINGGEGNDTFTVNARRGDEVWIEDLSSDDKLIINFKTEGNAFQGITATDGRWPGRFFSYINDATGNGVVRVESLLDDFDIDVTNGGTTVTITGQDFIA